MKILTWNIQATQGCDGTFNTNRIIEQIMQFGDLDVICLQEVARNIPSLNAEDQATLIANQFAGYEMVWAPGFSVPNAQGKRCEFGNLTFVKQTLFKNSRTHILASPVVDELQMPRTMAEVVVNTDKMTVAIFNTHLAFHSKSEQIAQLGDLTQLRDLLIAKANRPVHPQTTGPYIYSDAVQGVLLCGDLNIDSESSAFKTHILDRQWYDCWNSVNTDAGASEKQIRQPTCGCFDYAQWPEGPHVRDYFLATENIASETQTISVNVQTDASDHQPVFMEMDL